MTIPTQNDGCPVDGSQNPTLGSGWHITFSAPFNADCDSLNDLHETEGYSLDLVTGGEGAASGASPPSNLSYTIVHNPNILNPFDEQQFSNMRIIVELQNYFSGCSDINACNYFCIEKPWECPDGNLPANFVDDSDCDMYSCIGCMDSSASNYNPNATIASICQGGENEGINCMDNENICGDNGTCIEEPCEFTLFVTVPDTRSRV